MRHQRVQKLLKDSSSVKSIVNQLVESKPLKVQENLDPSRIASDVDNIRKAFPRTNLKELMEFFREELSMHPQQARENAIALIQACAAAEVVWSYVKHF